MTTEINTTELFAALDECTSEISKLIFREDESALNIVPFTDSWTAAQLAVHVTKSNKAIASALTMSGEPAKRNADDGVQRLKDMFLNFEVKFNSPEFIKPEDRKYSKEEVVTNLNKSIAQLKALREKANLFEIISIPPFGEITKLELLHFVVYHTQRHIHQLKNILKSIN